MNGRSNVARHFDGIKAEYGRYGTGLWAAYRRAAETLLRSHLPERPLRVLDLGGGALVSLPGLLEHPRLSEYVVVDLVDHLQPRPARLRVVRADALEYARSAETPPFDAAVIFGMLMYLTEERAAELLSRLRAIVAPGAPLIVHEPNETARPRLDAALERPVDVARLARASGWDVLSTGCYNVPAVRAVCARVDRVFGPLGPARCAPAASCAVALERRLGTGLDTLTLLRSPSADAA